MSFTDHGSSVVRRCSVAASVVAVEAAIRSGASRSAARYPAMTVAEAATAAYDGPSARRNAASVWTGCVRIGEWGAPGIDSTWSSPTTAANVRAASSLT